jgi:hypothetical protein
VIAEILVVGLDLADLLVEQDLVRSLSSTICWRISGMQLDRASRWRTTSRGLAGIGCIDQHAFDASRNGGATIVCGECARAVGHIGRSDRDGMGQPLGARSKPWPPTPDRS